MSSRFGVARRIRGTAHADDSRSLRPRCPVRLSDGLRVGFSYEADLPLDPRIQEDGPAHLLQRLMILLALGIV